MSYKVWGNKAAYDVKPFYEKVYSRDGLSDWDVRWEKLSTRARATFLEKVKSPQQNRPNMPLPTTPADNFIPETLKELIDLGFVQIREGFKGNKPIGNLVSAADGLIGFIARMRALRKYDLLNPDQPTRIREFLDEFFINSSTQAMFDKVLRASKIDVYRNVDSIIEHYLTKHRWPVFFLKAFPNPVGSRIVEELTDAKEPILAAKLRGKFKDISVDEFQSALESLVTHLVVMEGLETETLELMVGLLPSVRKDLERVSNPPGRPPLAVSENFKDLGFQGAILVGDVRSFLLEIASEPPRLKQDGSLFQKELERFKACLDPLSDWIKQTLRWNSEFRLNQAFDLTMSLQLTCHAFEGKVAQLQLTSQGNQWISGGLDAQIASLYSFLAKPVVDVESAKSNIPTSETIFDDYDDYYDDEDDYDFDSSSSDAVETPFLGSRLKLVKLDKKFSSFYYEPFSIEYRKAFRKQLDQGFSTLKPGIFYTMESVIDHLVFGEYNPLNLGEKIDKIGVYLQSTMIPPLEEAREAAARAILKTFIEQRLIPLGALKAAQDEQNRICIAREPLFDVYFGRKLPKTKAGSKVPEVTTKVVVQPDFSVILIGLDSAPAADLLPFCERSKQPGPGGHGAMILKISRESVVKAVSRGMKPVEILKRLECHASHDLPANVVKEVKEWSNSVKLVSVGVMTIMKCPDKATADRILGTFKSRAERVNDTWIAIAPAALTLAERKKLAGQGIIVTSDSEAPKNKSNAKKGNRRR